MAQLSLHSSFGKHTCVIAFPAAQSAWPPLLPSSSSNCICFSFLTETPC